MAGWNTIRPLARRVEDLRLALGVLSERPTTGESTNSLADRPVLVPRLVVVPPVGRDVANAVTNAAGVLGAAGMSVRRRVALPLTRTLCEVVAILHRHWLPSHRRALGGSRPVCVSRELLQPAKQRRADHRRVPGPGRLPLRLPTPCPRSRVRTCWTARRAAVTVPPRNAGRRSSPPTGVPDNSPPPRILLETVRQPGIHGDLQRPRFPGRRGAARPVA